MSTTITVVGTSYAPRRRQGANKVAGRGGTSATEQIKGIAPAGSYTGITGGRKRSLFVRGLLEVLANDSNNTFRYDPDGT